jgi:hypothetical protein
MKTVLSFFNILILSTTLSASNCNEPVTLERFNSLLESLDNKDMPDQKKYILISSYAQRECFSVDQLILFLDVVVDHKIQISTAQAVFNLVYDTENLDKLLNRFTDYEKKMIKKSIH